MFVDEATIFVEGGHGGDGCVSFRHEKHRPRGGPDGGDGGSGGDVRLVASASRATLVEYNRRRHFRAGAGGRGGANQRKGASGDTMDLPVPQGTVVMADDGTALADLLEPGQSAAVASGGRGGKGNASLARQVGRPPGFAEKGEPGQKATVRLEMKLVADVAIVGFPNAGKSSLISRLSNARPRVADYPFTTTEPNLGVVEGEDAEFVVTDVPGLVEGAHLGKGMGIDFLRHIERAGTILFLIDMSPYSGRKPSEELEALETELARYSPALIGRSRLVAANKMDLSPPAEELEVLVEECRIRGLTLIEISALTGSGLPGLLGALEQMVNDARSCGPPAESRTVVFAATETEGVKVRRKGETYLISGRNVERMVQMTDWGNDEARTHLAAKLRRRGVDEALSRAGAATGAQVEIAGRIFEYIPEDGRQDGNSDD